METNQKKYTREQIFNFNDDDWTFERSSGYCGQRNTNEDSPEYMQWISCDEEHERKCLKRQYEADYKLIHDFRLDQLPFGKYPDYHIHEFLNKKYFNK